MTDEARATARQIREVGTRRGASPAASTGGMTAVRGGALAVPNWHSRPQSFPALRTRTRTRRRVTAQPHTPYECRPLIPVARASALAHKPHTHNSGVPDAWRPPPVGGGPSAPRPRHPDVFPSRWKESNG